MQVFDAVNVTMAHIHLVSLGNRVCCVVTRNQAGNLQPATLSAAATLPAGARGHEPSAGANPTAPLKMADMGL